MTHKEKRNMTDHETSAHASRKKAVDNRGLTARIKGSSRRSHLSASIRTRWWSASPIMLGGRDVPEGLVELLEKYGLPDPQLKRLSQGVFSKCAEFKWPWLLQLLHNSGLRFTEWFRWAQRRRQALES